MEVFISKNVFKIHFSNRYFLIIEITKNIILIPRVLNTEIKYNIYK